jgi:predicted ATP-dependent endonuclease of OLD family
MFPRIAVPQIRYNQKKRIMQLKKFEVTGLFGEFDHSIVFPTRPEESTDPSVVLLCGPNGVGKTRILRMIEGFMRLDFEPFREVPFKSASLQFSDKSILSVSYFDRQRQKKKHQCLRVKFKGKHVDLAAKGTGALFEDESEKIDQFREAFFEFAESTKIQRISTSRLQSLYQEHERRQLSAKQQHGEDIHDAELAYARVHGRREKIALLGEQIKGFVRDAQLNSGRFFSGRDPGLFSKILETLTDSEEKGEIEVPDLKRRIHALNDQDKLAQRYQLFGERWNYKQLVSVLSKKGDLAPDQNALTVINTYLELLESRASERELLVTRLQTFENTLNEFLGHKTVSVNAKTGVSIMTSEGDEIQEGMLSSGEYHLLYLFVVALTTQRRGTVIAIDEPELSMHLGWQRKLIPALVQCASSAQPQFIVATHSPDITASYPNSCEHLGSLEK